MENGFLKGDEEGLPELSSRFVQTRCPAIQGFVSHHQILLTNYNCNYGRKGKGNSTVSSSTAYESTKSSTNTGVDCVWKHCRAETFPQSGRLPWSSQKEKAGTQQGCRRHLGKDFFSLLPSLILMLAVYIPKSRCFSGSVLLKPEQASDNQFIAIFC